MIKAIRLACVAAVFVALAGVGRAAPSAENAKLKVGDPAPALYLSKFIKGEPVTELEKGKIYVIECWATWCGPCDAAEQAKFDKSVDELQEKLSTAAQAKDYDKAIDYADQVVAQAPGMGLYLRPAKLRFFYMKGDYTGGNKLAGEMAADDVAQDPT